MSTQLKRPIWICGIGQTAAGDLTLTAGSEEEGAEAGRAYAALGIALPTTAGTREITTDRRYL